MSSFDLLQEIRELLKGNVEKNQSRSIAIFASALEATLAGIESTVDIVEVTTDYTASSRNSCILADASSGDVNVYLPKAEDFINYAAGTTKLLYVKKADAGGDSVIIHADVVDTIEGSPTYPLTSPLEAITLASDGNDWFIIATNGSGGGGGGSGDVVGPVSATDNAVVRFNLTSGKLVQNSLVTITDLGSIALPVGETVDGRDVSVDGAKLDTIETNADVTDATNVAAAGAVMESDYTPAHSLLVQQSGTGSPSSLSVGNNTILGRASGGGSPIAALSASSVKTILDYQASEVDFTPNGDIAATDVQSAIVEVRNDTDTKLGAKVQIGGQLGGTISSPTVIAITETGGPTALTIGAIADGELVGRVGTELRGVTGGGGGGSSPIPGVRGFSPANYLSAGAGSFPGVASAPFSFAVLARPRVNAPGDEILFSNANTFLNHSGVRIGHQAGTGFSYYVSLGDGVSSSLFFVADTSELVANAGKLVLIHGVYTGTNIVGYFNGTRASGSPAQAFAPSGEVSRIGLGPFGIAEAASFDIFGVAYIEDALTDAEVFEHWDACAKASDFVQSSIAWDEFNAGHVAAGTLPSQVGGVDFTEIGTLTNINAAVVWR